MDQDALGLGELVNGRVVQSHTALPCYGSILGALAEVTTIRVVGESGLARKVIFGVGIGDVKTALSSALPGEV